MGQEGGFSIVDPPESGIALVDDLKRFRESVKGIWIFPSGRRLRILPKQSRLQQPQPYPNPPSAVPTAPHNVEAAKLRQKPNPAQECRLHIQKDFVPPNRKAEKPGEAEERRGEGYAIHPPLSPVPSAFSILVTLLTTSAEAEQTRIPFRQRQFPLSCCEWPRGKRFQAAIRPRIVYAQITGREERRRRRRRERLLAAKGIGNPDRFARGHGGGGGGSLLGERVVAGAREGRD
ncbi:hypothetical protein DFH27DRAFT_609113 [Peziza echinospora]|nr:hypothetical protein DFH27DRAFT_609113 [Peziza echinospora]